MRFFVAFWKDAKMIKFLFLSAGLFTLVECQSLIPAAGSATFPGCAVGCLLLQEAQANCVPPAAPRTNQATYISCFCQSSLLQALHSSPNGVCDAVCPPRDLSTLQTWYAGLCSAGNPELTQTTTTSATPNTHSNPKSDPPNENSAPPSWYVEFEHFISYHIPSPPCQECAEQQGLHLTIEDPSTELLIGFPPTGAWLKRRHKRKRINQPPPFTPAQTAGTTSRNLVAAALGDDKWSPQQHVAHTRAHGPGSTGSSAPSPSVETLKGTESGQFTRAPHRSSRNMRRPSRLKNQL
ncbi:hypothetical protein AJ78_02756 [Emergomyces pasteurianus Ep9510]|uniref:Integral membrane protein n=1 Tax=Emergomyces pasteurianus Ep9510 TaxID=1447872 RepID=A0A1J9PKT1_9EURO|nr:hypothetical protein AJ78_02756 [Emergomyces pasteurianus Ep9510]